MATCEILDYLLFKTMWSISSNLEVISPLILILFQKYFSYINFAYNFNIQIFNATQNGVFAILDCFSLIKGFKGLPKDPLLIQKQNKKIYFRTLSKAAAKINDTLRNNGCD